MQIKSATRVLQILEFFDQTQRDANVMEIARALDIPQSSTSMLLKNLVAMGYLHYDLPRRAYAPTPKVSRLGNWIEPVLHPDPAIIAAMEVIGAETGGTIILGVMAGEMVRYVHVVPATTPLRLHLSTGTTRPLALSSMGRLFMAQLAPERVREIVRNYNAAAGSAEVQLNLAAVTRELTTIRAQNYSVSLARVTRGAGIVAVLLPGKAGRAPMALGIGAPVHTIQEHYTSWIALMRRVTTRYLRR